MCHFQARALTARARPCRTLSLLPSPPKFKIMIAPSAKMQSQDEPDWNPSCPSMNLQGEGEINLCCFKVLRFGGCYCRMILPVLTSILSIKISGWFFPWNLPSPAEPDPGTASIADKHVVAECE